ncbi:hypothetical protein BC936DRAFT_148089 [Jimgerdemannia flammicorona]|uniref:Uncharacterized protein n=1 Tax=Jimgerdemannia flammicorona TaxID=994334 RepID=A0A433D3T7_9FUNG|nr:hypothetical protein BC936DRAFT_148089 [Jimgerdemannia flammicorona]
MATVRPPRIPSTPQTYRNGGGGKRKRSVLEEEEKAAEIGEGETSDAPASEEIGEESVMGTEAEAETAQGSREDRESWALLHKKTFTLHRCTPLYDLRPDWEGYARELKGYLVAEMENGAGGADDDIDDLRIGGKIVRVGFTGIELGGWRGGHPLHLLSPPSPQIPAAARHGPDAMAGEAVRLPHVPTTGTPLRNARHGRAMGGRVVRKGEGGTGHEGRQGAAARVDIRHARGRARA